MHGWKRAEWIRNGKEFLIINGGVFLVALGIHAFKTPNQFAFGGVSGIAVVLRHFLQNQSMGTIMLIINAVLLVAGYFVLGKSFAAKSVYSSFALSGMVWLMDVIAPINSPLTSQKFMELMYAVFLPGMGSAIVFSTGATTGGTDIIAKILSKYIKMKISVTLLCTDLLVAISAGLIFGVESCLFSLMGVALKSFLLDSVLESLHIYKIVTVISPKSHEIKDFICNRLHRGATVHLARGAFTVEEKEVITTVLNRRQALALRQYIKLEDPGAFITISNSTEIIGKGFGGFE